MYHLPAYFGRVACSSALGEPSCSWAPAGITHHSIPETGLQVDSPGHIIRRAQCKMKTRGRLYSDDYKS